MKKADMNRGMQRLMESYKPRISESDVLKFLNDKGFDTSAQETKNYADAVAEYLSYDPEVVSLEDWYEGTKLNYPEDLEDLPRLDESLEKASKSASVADLSKKIKSKLTSINDKVDNLILHYNTEDNKIDDNQRLTPSEKQSKAKELENSYKQKLLRLINSSFSSLNESVYSEALSDEAKANNEMIQKILSKSPSQLTPKEKKFLADNDLIRTGGKGQTPSIGKSGAPYWNTISKGDRNIISRGNWASKSKHPFADIDNVDQLNLLKKRQDRWEAHNDKTNRDILEPLPHLLTPGSSELQDFNKRYQHDIENSKYHADSAKRNLDSYLKTGSRFDANETQYHADVSRNFRDRATKSLENRPKFSEALEDDDYFDFVHDLSTAVKDRTKKWQSRGISASDVAKALDELSVRFEDLSDEAVEESLNFKTMPIPKEGATFAFRATVDEPEVSRLLQKKNLKFDKVNENGTIVWLIGHGDTDHIATYIPSTKTLYTDTRELFKEALSLKKK